jgi:hypothetical protein
MLGLKHGCGIMADPTTMFGKVLHLQGDKGALGGDVEWHNITPLFLQGGRLRLPALTTATARARR